MQVDRFVVRKNQVARIGTMLALFILAAMMLAPRPSYAISQGVVSTTQKPGSSGGGCASCHNVGGTSAGSANGNVASVVISGPATLDAGGSGIYTVTLTQTTHSAGAKAGINVEADDGTLSNAPSQSTVIENGQVKHTTNGGIALHTTNASGVATYQFRYTMPASAAAGSTHTLYAAGAIGNAAGWRHAPNFVVTTGAALSDPPRLANISTRMQVLTGENVLIGGFIIQGAGQKTVVVRARGPSLAAQGVPGTLGNPNLQLFSGANQIASNDDWPAASNATAIQNSGFAPDHGNESAIMMTLDPGAYTAIVSGVGGTGVAIVEVFEVDARTVPLVNISSRGLVQTGDNVMIGGFIIQGTGPQTVVVRARGPSLSSQGVSGALSNPNLQLFSGPTQIASNNDWGQAANAAAIQASGLQPDHPQESAVMMTLQPGAYTAIVSGIGGVTGVGIVEVFTTSASP